MLEPSATATIESTAAMKIAEPREPPQQSNPIGRVALPHTA